MHSVDYIHKEGSDTGKRFVITRMPLFTGDKWARRLVKEFARTSDAILQHDFQPTGTGIAGLALSLFGHMDTVCYEEGDEALLACIQIRRGNDPAIQPAPLLEADIQDPMTLTRLREEALKLHIDFLKAAFVQVMPLAIPLLEEIKTSKMPFQEEAEERYEA